MMIVKPISQFSTDEKHRLLLNPPDSNYFKRHPLTEYYKDYLFDFELIDDSNSVLVPKQSLLLKELEEFEKQVSQLFEKKEEIEKTLPQNELDVTEIDKQLVEIQAKESAYRNSQKILKDSIAQLEKELKKIKYSALSKSAVSLNDQHILEEEKAKAEENLKKVRYQLDLLRIKKVELEEQKQNITNYYSRFEENKEKLDITKQEISEKIKQLKTTLLNHIERLKSFYLQKSDTSDSEISQLKSEINEFKEFVLSDLTNEIVNKLPEYIERQKIKEQITNYFTGLSVSFEFNEYYKIFRDIVWIVSLLFLVEKNKISSANTLRFESFISCEIFKKNRVTVFIEYL